MKYLEEIRDGDKAKIIIKNIIKTINPAREYFFLDFVVGRTHPIHRFSLESYLPENVHWSVVARNPWFSIEKSVIDASVLFSRQSFTIFCSYNELMQVSGGLYGSLIKARSEGSDIRAVYSIHDAIHFAKQNPSKQIIFLAVGFESDMLETASALKQVKQMNLTNFSVFCNHYQALYKLQDAWKNPLLKEKVNGIILPLAHSSSLPIKTHTVISGFQPIDILQGFLWLIEKNNQEDSVSEIKDFGNKSTLQNQEMLNDLHDVFNFPQDIKNPVTLSLAYQEFDCSHRVASQPAADNDDSLLNTDRVTRSFLRNTFNQAPI